MAEEGIVAKERDEEAKFSVRCLPGGVEEHRDLVPCDGTHSATPVSAEVFDTPSVESVRCRRQGCIRMAGNHRRSPPPSSSPSTV